MEKSAFWLSYIFMNAIVGKFPGAVLTWLFVLSPQTRIRVCWADWTSLFPLWEKIESTFTHELALFIWTLQNHSSHVCFHCLSRTKVDGCCSLFSLNALSLFSPCEQFQWVLSVNEHELNKCVVLTCEASSCSQWAIRGQQEHTNTAQT